MKLSAVVPIALAAISSVMLVLPATAEESDAEIVKKSLNPVANLTSVPFKLDYDHNIGPLEQGKKYQLTVQPVIPFSIGADWSLISRSLIPVIHQNAFTPVTERKFGLGDVTQQFYFSPKAPTADGWIWGVGPQALLRTGTDNLSSDKWGLGPTGVVLKQEHGWTYGVLANHMWSVAGSNQAPSISNTYLQPFLSYTTPRFTTYGINSESNYNWKTNQWSVPINATVTQMLKVHGQLLTLQGGLRYWAATPDSLGPKGWGARLQLTFLFPE